MATQEIARNEWSSFLDEFGKRHRDELVNVQVIGDEVGVHPEAEGLPLMGITTEDKGSERGAISLLLGTKPEDHIEHHIDAPTHIWLKSTGDHTRDALEIEDSDGTKTILEIQQPPLLKRG